MRRPTRTEVSDDEAKSRLQEQLMTQLDSSEDEVEPDVAQKDIKTAVETAMTHLSDLKQRVAKTNGFFLRLLH
ncbi:unnamed protein product [Schistosoma curassoni]|uniref:V-SNARE coiled-coil homology domain-containing protein n=1 Tax=Schistosoma curassoni TaxID=6186 RepID=A0A183KNF2_9TREM|nr:unnamed protein product [Schistosoma curassoni]